MLKITLEMVVLAETGKSNFNQHGCDKIGGTPQTLAALVGFPVHQGEKDPPNKETSDMDFLGPAPAPCKSSCSASISSHSALDKVKPKGLPRRFRTRRKESNSQRSNRIKATALARPGTQQVIPVWSVKQGSGCIIHLSIALYMVVSLHFGGKSNMFQMGKMYLLRSPVKTQIQNSVKKGSPKHKHALIRLGSPAKSKSLALAALNSETTEPTEQLKSSVDADGWEPPRRISALEKNLHLSLSTSELGRRCGSGKLAPW